MKKFNFLAHSQADPKKIKQYLVHDSPYFKIILFNFLAGQELTLHTHELDGQKSMHVLAGHGDFLTKDNSFPVETGDIVILDIIEPHGLRARTDLSLLITIAPPI